MYASFNNSYLPFPLFPPIFLILFIYPVFAYFLILKNKEMLVRSPGYLRVCGSVPSNS